MHETINEPIKVLVSFLGTQVKPLSFVWQGRRYNPTKINLVHSERKGDSRIYYFSVSDNANFYRLAFDNQSLEWRLLEIYFEG